MVPLWEVLYTHGAEIVFSGHDHHYERFAPQTAAGKKDSTYGIREFLVGTGGRGLYSLKTIRANREIRYNGGHGVLRLVLKSNSYSWEFVSAGGKTFTDTGTGSCHSAPPSGNAAALALTPLEPLSAIMPRTQWVVA